MKTPYEIKRDRLREIRKQYIKPKKVDEYPLWNTATKRFETVSDSKEPQAPKCLRPPYVR